MRLIRLNLINFRQHADSRLEFRPGLTGIIGPNGAGKTTILEAIAWAIYGAPAVRGTNDTLRFNRAPGRSSVRAELEFELRGERYRVLRTPRSAELYRIESADPIAGGLSEVTRQLTRRLGMTRQEFFNTYFTGQKELQFLAAMGPAERARFLSQVLGYERLRAAQGLVREQRKVLKGQVDELRRALGDPEEIEKRREEADRRLREVNDHLEGVGRRLRDVESRFADVEPEWTESQRARDRHREMDGELRIAGARLESVVKARGEIDEELGRLAADAGRLEILRAEAQPLRELRTEDERLRLLADADARRQTLGGQLEEQRARVAKLAQRVAEHEDRGRTLEALRSRLAESEAECERLEAEREETVSRWQRDRQDVEARLRILRDQGKDLKRRIEQLTAEGPDGSCPTCKRPLGSEYDRVLELIEGQYEELVQDGKWHARRLEQLADEPEELKAARDAVTEAQGRREALRKEASVAEHARDQAAALQAELANEEAQARALAGAIGELPEGYDAERHAEVRSGLERLGELEREITQLETRLERQAELRKGKAEVAEEARQIRARIEALEAGREELGFSEERFRELGERFEEVRKNLDATRLECERVRGEAEAARQAAEAARGAEREYRQLARTVVEREAEHRLHNELDTGLGALRDELNDRVRPELSEIASVFLAELTDGRYNRIDITRDYQVVVLDDGEEKPVISGGEEDLANLVLRLAISQMIADRAGQTLSLLIFDEVFGGLDEQRRESVIRLLQRLQDRFEQVILITHIESIREGMDQVARVSYDESTGASTIRDESPGAGPDVPRVEDLAVLVAD